MNLNATARSMQKNAHAPPTINRIFTASLSLRHTNPKEKTSATHELQFSGRKNQRENIPHGRTQILNKLRSSAVTTSVSNILRRNKTELYTRKRRRKKLVALFTKPKRGQTLYTCGSDHECSYTLSTSAHEILHQESALLQFQLRGSFQSLSTMISSPHGCIHPAAVRASVRTCARAGSRQGR